MKADPDRVTMSARLPKTLRDFLVAEAQSNGSSINSELVRAVRERMDRLATDQT